MRSLNNIITKYFDFNQVPVISRSGSKAILFSSSYIGRMATWISGYCSRTISVTKRTIVSNQPGHKWCSEGWLTNVEHKIKTPNVFWKYATYLSGWLLCTNFSTRWETKQSMTLFRERTFSSVDILPIKIS